MELNIKKQSVCVNELSFNQNVEQGIDFTVNIPEYCGKVERLLKYNLIPRINSKVLNGQTLTIEGAAYFSLIFVDENGCVLGHEYVAPFSKSIDICNVIDCYKITAKSKCSYLNAKVISSSRIDVNSVVELSLNIYSKKSTEVISNIDCTDVYQNCGEIRATTPVSSAEKNMIIDEELEIPAGLPALRKILWHNASVIIGDTKIVNNKVITKGEFKLHVLYCSDDVHSPVHFDETVPFSQIIELENINNNCGCHVSAEIASYDIKPRSNYEGEVRNISLCAKLLLTADAHCDNNITVVLDAYSPKIPAVTETCNTQFYEHKNTISEVFVCKKKLEFSDGELGNLIDAWCTSTLQGYRIEDNHLHISGTILVCGITVCDGSAGYFERPIDFEYKSPLNDLPECVKIEPEITVLNSDFQIVGGSVLEVGVELSLSAEIYENCHAELLCSFTTDADADKKKSDCSMVIYYAERGELTWNIAKRYGASPEDIMTVNNIETVVPDNMPIIISC